MIDSLTQEQYKKIALRIRKKYLTELGMQDCDWETVAQWMVDTQWRSLSHSTWRLYRSALTYFVSLKDPASESIIANILNTGRAPEEEKKIGNPYTVNHKKAKKFNGKDSELVLKYLMQSGCKWDKLAFFWMIAGTATGLRPSEWFQTALHTDPQGDPYLLVNNAKNTQGRAHGDTRTINLNHCSEKQVKSIKMFFKSIAGLQETFKTNGIDKYAPNDIYKVCADAMRRTNRLFWNRRIYWYTLYSARHQFAADCKARGLSKKEVAALMGHATDETAGSHYGRKNMGTSGRPPKAKQEEVDRVRSVAYNPHALKDGAAIEHDKK